MRFLIENVLSAPALLFSDVICYFYPPPSDSPDIVKAYPVRRDLPIQFVSLFHKGRLGPAYKVCPRIFLPKITSQAQSAAGPPHLLPTIFTIHGGGFVLGRA